MKRGKMTWDFDWELRVTDGPGAAACREGICYRYHYYYDTLSCVA